MTALTHLAPTAPVDEVLAELYTTGAVIVDRLADAATLDRLDEEMAPWVAATPPGSDDFSGRRTTRTGALVARSPASHSLIRDPLVLATAGRLLDRARAIQLHLTQLISIGPDSPAQPLHRDQWAFDFFPFPPDYHVQCNTIWALTDFTEENGATRVLPGSQDLPDSQSYTHDATVPAEMERGSCLLYTGKVYHGGGANSSPAARVGLNITYDVAWLRQEENQYLSVPPEIAAGLDDDFLRLIGYRIGAYALGYVDDVRDPLEVFRGRTGTMSFGASP